MLPNAPKQNEQICLESLPIEILEKKFIRTDDVGFSSLFDTCTKFQAIVNHLLPKRCFTFRGDDDPADSLEIVNRFGSAITAMEFNQVAIIDANHWAFEVMYEIADYIRKLQFNHCILESQNFSRLKLNNLTHLVYEGNFYSDDSQCFSEIQFPDCDTLEKIEAHGSWQQQFCIKSLQRIIRKNTSLDGLLMYDFDVDDISLWELIMPIANLSHIKQLALVINSKWKPSPDPENLDQICNMFNRLESLELSIDSHTIGLLGRLAKEFKRIKFLELRVRGKLNQSEEKTLIYIAQSAHSAQIAISKQESFIDMYGFFGKAVELQILDNSRLGIGRFSAIRAKDLPLLEKVMHS